MVFVAARAVPVLLVQGIRGTQHVPRRIAALAADESRVGTGLHEASARNGGPQGIGEDAAHGRGCRRRRGLGTRRLRGRRRCRLARTGREGQQCEYREQGSHPAPIPRRGQTSPHEPCSLRVMI
ncbi:serine/threonine protein kinase [Cystobacter fuscus DSM 2262]|uniref:Serine/threonine protein kinase n=1 Tax=Cystobacter fuscus (strain ATCC 25194 / DSM 2262 / NBRC 100088 / M29) TaxID=1242864 RepID=S9QM74_CYSF2|nr:serine/threonine protein kinase [Cystobacter fuscus DSM 2262]